MQAIPSPRIQLQNQVRTFSNQVIQNNQFRQYSNQGPFYRPNINYSNTPSYSSNFTYSQPIPNQQRIAFPPQIITNTGVNISQNVSQQQQIHITQQKYDIKAQPQPLQQLQTLPQPQPQPQTQTQSQTQTLPQAQ